MQQRTSEDASAPVRPVFVTADSAQTLINHTVSPTPEPVGQKEQIDEETHGSTNEETFDIESQITVIGSDDSKAIKFNLDGDLTFPEGGLKAYLVVFGSFMGLIACFGLMNIVGAIESYVKHNQLANANTSTVGWIFSISTFITYTSCIFSGTYFDRNGTRTLLISGTTLMVSGLVATASCQTVWQFILAFGILCSFGNGLLMSPLISVISHYFSKKRGLYCSLAASGGGIGGVIFPIMLRSLYPKIGFEWAIRVLALIFLFCLGIAISLIKERFNKKEEIKEDSIKKRILDYVNIFDKETMTDSKFIYCTLGALFAEISTFSCITYFGSYAIMRGFSIDDSYLLITLVNLGTVPGRAITGYLADVFGRFNVMIITMTLTTVVNLGMWMPFGAHLSVLYGYAVLYGFISGAVFSLLPVCCGQISRTSDFGKRYSVMYFFVAFGTLVGIPIAGAIIGDSSSSITRYNWFIVYTAIMAIISAVFYFASRFCVVAWSLTVRF